MQRFPGMTEPVAVYLATKVFCLLDDPKDDSPRALAGDFGAWVRDLPDLLGVPSGGPGNRHAMSHGTTQDHSFAVFQTRPPTGRQVIEPITPVDNDGVDSRATSTYRRRKRGRRIPKIIAPSPIPTDEHLEDLARMLSRTPQVPPFRPELVSRRPSARSAASPTFPAVEKRPSKWKPSFGRSSSWRMRLVSPTSTQNEQPVTSSANLITSGIRRSSMSTTSSAGNSTAFTRFSNSSVSTIATSACASSS